MDGFVATQNDYLQASVPAPEGMLWYLIELYGVGTKPPSAFKLGRMETGKLLANLSMAKFFKPSARALLMPRRNSKMRKPKRRRRWRITRISKPTWRSSKAAGRDGAQRAKRRRRKVNPFRATTSDKDRLTALAERLILSMASAQVNLPAVRPESLWALAIAVEWLVAQRERPRR